jgi:hypothetical protein
MFSKCEVKKMALPAVLLSSSFAIPTSTFY